MNRGDAAAATRKIRGDDDAAAATRTFGRDRRARRRYADVYTKVSAFTDWIDETIAGWGLE